MRKTLLAAAPILMIALGPQCSKFLRRRPPDHVPIIRQEMGLTTGPGQRGLQSQP